MELGYYDTLGRLMGWLDVPVNVSVAQPEQEGPPMVLGIYTTLGAGWDLTVAEDNGFEDTVFFSFAGDQGSGLFLERTSFRRAWLSEDEDALTIYIGGVQVQVELLSDAERSLREED